MKTTMTTKSQETNNIGENTILFTKDCECAICLNKLKSTDISITPCGHKFCFTCLAENMRRSQACPLCRTKLCDPGKSKIISDDHFDSIQFNDSQEIFSRLRRITKGFNHIFNAHRNHFGHGMNKNMLTIDPILYDQVYNNNDIPEHLQLLGNYVEEISEDENSENENEISLYEFNQEYHNHPTVGGLRLPQQNIRSSAPSPSTNNSTEDSDEESDLDDNYPDSDDSDYDDLFEQYNNLLRDLEKNEETPVWQYEKELFKLILESRFHSMYNLCNWYEEN